MAFIDDLRRDYANLNDPRYAQSLTDRRVGYLRPGLNDIFSSIDQQMTSQGLFSSSPVSTAKVNAGQRFYSGVAQSVDQDLMEKYRTIVPTLANMEIDEIHRKMQNDAGFGKFIGNILGMGMGFLLPTGFKMPTMGLGYQGSTSPQGDYPSSDGGPINV
jgi:hypothetical protein